MPQRVASPFLLLLGVAVLLARASQDRLPTPPAGAGQAAPADVLGSQAYYVGAATGRGDRTLLLQGTAVVAPPLPGSTFTGVLDPEACSLRCSRTANCSSFVHCNLHVKAGCSDGAGATLPLHSCRLLGAACSVPLQALGRDAGVEVISGFPVRDDASFPSTVRRDAVLGQAIEGADMPCPGSLELGKCVLRRLDDAVALCFATAPLCRSIVVYERGLDGCSLPVTVLKTENYNPNRALVHPHVNTYSNLDVKPPYPFWLHADECEVIEPGLADLQLEGPSSSTNGSSSSSSNSANGSSTSWHGCALSRSALMDGTVVATLDGLASPEACCRACRQFKGNSTGGVSTCNVWNFCDQAAGCSFQATDAQPEPVKLSKGQCELRFQALADASLGAPPFVITKGPGVQFVGGAPLALSGPPLPGFRALPGRGVGTNGRFACSGSLRPSWDCLLQGPAPELAQQCLDNPQCGILSLKPASAAGNKASGSNSSSGSGGSSSSGGSSPVYNGVLRTNLPSEMYLMVPTTVMYVREDDASVPSPGSEAGTSGSSSGGVSVGAIAGIAAGAAVATVAALAVLVVWVRRVKRRGQALAAGRCAECSGSPCTSGKGPYSSKDVDSAAGMEAGRCAPLCGAGGNSGNSGTSSRAGSAALCDFDRMGSKATEATVLTELIQHVAGLEAKAQQQELESAGSDHSLVSVTSLPPHLQAWAVDSRDVEYERCPNGAPVEIGRGASACVYKARLNGELVAAKEIDIGASQQNREAFLQEALQLHALRHPNVVAFYGLAITGTKGVVFCEYCPGHDLYSALDLTAAGSSTERVFAWRRRGRRVALDVARALNFLHSKGVVHMDLKSPNVLLTATGTAKLCDVAFSRIQQRTFLSDVQLVGTFAWVAPEVLMGSLQCTQAVDIYSMGVVMWELITGERPQRGNLRLPRVPEECPQEVCDLMLRCLSESPADRPTALELMTWLEQKQALGRSESSRRTRRASAAAAVAAPTPPATPLPFAN